MSTPLLSIIIPVYQAAATLERCLRSILSQAPAESEILLVDDGSTDGSAALCDEWAARDSRVRAFHRKNGGASAARNSGLQYAKGTYIQFVDSDDALLPGLYETVLPRLESGCEVCVFACKNAGQATPNEAITPVENVALSDIPQKEIERYLLSTGVFFSPINKVFARSLWKKSEAIFPPELRVNEDAAFNYQLLAQCGSITMLPDAFYEIYLEEGSLSRQFRTDLYACAVATLPLLKDFLSAAGFTAGEADAFCEKYRGLAAVRQYTLAASHPGDLTLRRKILADLLADPLTKNAICGHLAADPNRAMALPLLVLAKCGLSGLMARLFDLRCKTR